MLPLLCSYISGYKNRFQNFIKHLREMGDEVFILLPCTDSHFLVIYASFYEIVAAQVLVVTTHKGAHEEFYGAKVIGSWR